MKQKWLDRTLVGIALHLTLVTSEREFHRAMKHCKVPQSDWGDFAPEGVGGRCVTLEQGAKRTCIVIIPAVKGSTGIDYASRIVHEAMHVWRVVREVIGEFDPSLEFEAYSMENITRILFKEFARQTKGKT